MRISLAGPLAALMVLLAPMARAPAADYLVLHAGTDSVLLLDRASIRRVGDRSELWLVERFDQPVAASAQRPGYQSVRLRYAIDCKTRELVLAERQFLSGRLGGEVRARDALPGQPAPPTDELERTLVAFACGG